MANASVPSHGKESGFDYHQLFARAARDDNPFTRATPTPSARDELAGGTRYRLHQSAPSVSSAEVELANVRALELLVMWGDSVLTVEHLTPPRTVYVGESIEGEVASDCFIPAEALGARRLPIVVESGGDLELVIPGAARGHIDGGPSGRVEIDAVRATARPSSEIAGACTLPLHAGERARIELGAFVIQVSAVNAGKPTAKGIATTDKEPAMYFGLALLANAALIGSLAAFTPPLGTTDPDEMNADRMYLIQQYLNSAAEREQAEVQENLQRDDGPPAMGETGQRAKNEEGKMGSMVSRATNKRFGIEGPANNPDPHVARDMALREAKTFGIIGILNTMQGSPNSPTAVFGRDEALGRDPMSALGNMWGDEIGEGAGSGGLGLTGIGEGGGGYGEGIGLGNVGTIAGGLGNHGQFWGRDVGRVAGHHDTRVPTVKYGITTVSGHLPPEVIQRIVRQNYGRFRMCYEQGLTANPNLEGRVSVRFVIGRDGAVSNVSNGGSDLPDSKVVSCVISAYYGLSFPEPEGGIVSVVYPIMFSPG